MTTAFAIVIALAVVTVIGTLVATVAAVNNDNVKTNFINM